MEDPKQAPDAIEAPASGMGRLPDAEPCGTGGAPTAPLETWTPEGRHARVPLAAGMLVPIAVTVTVFALATRSLFPVAAAAFALLIWWMARGSRSRHDLLTHNVCFELTRTSVRVRLAEACREVPLSEIEAVTVLPASRKADVGHVVMHQKGKTREPPAIPTGRRVNAGTVGLVTWANVELVDPADQLFEGALTFWFVPRPEMVRQRLLAALAGVTPHARGPHR
jgi:hypothetical protein